MKLITVSLSSFPAHIAGAEPTPALVNSIRQLGLLEPIILIQNSDGTVDIGAGRRRIKAARLAGLERIPCIIHKGVDKDAVTLITNHLRSPNLAVELKAAEILIADNDEREVCKHWNLHWQSFCKLLKLRSLILPLRQLLSRGVLRQGVAERAARLPVEMQGQLVGLKKITGEEVAKLFQARRSQAAEDLPDELFEEVKAEDPLDYFDYHSLVP